MTTTTLIAKRIEQSNKDWEEGRATSPAPSDYVWFAHEILTKTEPTYVGSTDEGREELAGVLGDTMDDGTSLTTPNEVAAWLVTELTAE